MLLEEGLVGDRCLSLCMLGMPVRALNLLCLLLDEGDTSLTSFGQRFRIACNHHSRHVGILFSAGLGSISFIFIGISFRCWQGS